MSGHLGTLAHLLPAIPTTQSVASAAERFSVQESASRRWVFARSVGPLLRSWDVSVDLLSPEESGLLSEFLHGGWGVGPFVFVPCEAHESNVLTPGQAGLVGVANGGPVETGSGVAARSLVGGGRVVLADEVPVRPGFPCTVSVYQAGGSLSVEFCTAGGKVVGDRSVEASGLLGRVFVSVPRVPVAARYARVVVEGFVRVARPQLSWTSFVPEWGPGLGAGRVVVQGGSFSSVRSPLLQGRVSLLEVG